MKTFSIKLVLLGSLFVSLALLFSHVSLATNDHTADISFDLQAAKITTPWGGVSDE